MSTASSRNRKVLVLGVAGAIGLGAWYVADRMTADPEPTSGEAAGAPVQPPAAPTTTDYATALVGADERIVSETARAERMGNSWMARQRVVEAYMARARLTGSYDDWEAAGRWLERAFEIAPEGGGPIMTRVALDFSLHRLEPIEADLRRAEDAAVVDDHQRSEILARRGDVCFHRLQLDQAIAAFREAHRLHETTGNAFRIAQYYWKVAELAQAEQYLNEAERLLVGESPQTRAFLHLQRGLMDLDRGRYDDALAHYRDADAAFGGYWLVEEHMAEIDAIQGRAALAIEKYRDLVERTESPELMDALAEALIQTDPAESALWTARARQAWEDRLARLPEAAYGHAIDHYSGDDDQVERALELAEANHRLRPGGEAKQLLAQAYAKAGRLADARRIVDELGATRWSTAESHAIASMVLAAAGEADRAAVERQAAVAIRPDVMDDYEWMVEALD